jgi:hypothetical protein
MLLRAGTSLGMFVPVSSRAMRSGSSTTVSASSMARAVESSGACQLVRDVDHQPGMRVGAAELQDPLAGLVLEAQPPLDIALEVLHSYASLSWGNPVLKSLGPVQAGKVPAKSLSRMPALPWSLTVPPLGG